MKKIPIIFSLILFFIIFRSFLLFGEDLSYKNLNAQALEYSRQGDDVNTVKLLEKAIAAYEKSTKSEETIRDYFIMRENLGFAYMRLGQVEKGGEIFDKASREYEAFLENKKKQYLKNK